MEVPMPDPIETADGQDAGDNEQPNSGRTFTQEDLNRFLAEDRRKNAAKYADYEQIKSALAEYKAAEDKNLSEAEQAKKQVGELRAMVETLTADLQRSKFEELRVRIAGEFNVPADHIFGDDEDGLRQSAKNLAEFAQSKNAGPTNLAAAKGDPGGKGKGSVAENIAAFKELYKKQG
jgi:DNA-binding transcriptional MerR regulator